MGAYAVVRQNLFIAEGEEDSAAATTRYSYESNVIPLTFAVPFVQETGQRTLSLRTHVGERDHHYDRKTCDVLQVSVAGPFSAANLENQHNFSRSGARRPCTGQTECDGGERRLIVHVIARVRPGRYPFRPVNVHVNRPCCIGQSS